MKIDLMRVGASSKFALPEEFPISFLVSPAKADVHCSVAAMTSAEQ